MDSKLNEQVKRNLEKLWTNDLKRDDFEFFIQKVESYNPLVDVLNKFDLIGGKFNVEYGSSYIARDRLITIDKNVLTMS